MRGLSLSSTPAPAVLGRLLRLTKNLKLDYGATGSFYTDSVNMTSGSNTVTLTAAGDWRNGQAVVVLHAGSAPLQGGTGSTALAAPTSLSVTKNGSATGTQSYTYYVAAVDKYGGITAAASVSATNMPATLSASTYLKVAWTRSTGAACYAIWGDPTNPTASQGLLAVTTNNNWSDAQYGTQSGMTFASSNLYPTTAPTSALGQNLFTTISSGAGTTTLTLSASAQSTVSAALMTHDDSAAWTAAATDLSGGGIALYIPDGKYYIRQDMDVSNSTNFSIEGNGPSSIIQAISGYTGNPINISNCSSFVVRDIQVNGGKSDNPFGQSDTSGSEEYQNNVRVLDSSDFVIHNVWSFDCWFSGIKLGGQLGTQTNGACTKATISDCIIEGSYDQGIGVWNSTYITVGGCTAHAAGWAGISITQSNYCTVAGNTCNENYYNVNAPNSEGHGIALEGATGNTIANNTCTYNCAEAMHLDIGPFNSTYATQNTISNNTFAFSQNQSSGVNINRATYTKLKGNVITGNTYYGVQMASASANTTIEGGEISNNTYNGVNGSGAASLRITGGVQFYGNGNEAVINAGYGTTPCTGLVVRGCFFDSNGVNGSPTIHASSCNNFDISENEITNAHANGIFIETAGGTTMISSYGKVNGNTILNSNNEGIITLNVQATQFCDNVVQGNHGNGGIDLRGATNCNIRGNTAINNHSSGIILEDNGSTYSEYNTIQGNICIDDQASPTQTYGIQEAGNSNYNRFLDNDCRNNTTAQLTVIGANSTQTNGNRIA